MRRHAITFSTLFLFAACDGGGTASGPVEGLQGPQQVTIIDSNGGAAVQLLPAGLHAVAGSDYQTDPTRFWVRDDSMQALDTVNMILSSLDQTRYWLETNQGAYRCLVEMDDRSGGERGNQGPAYEEWIVDSTRADRSAPQIVRFWVLNEENGEAAVIHGRLTVTASPTDAQPLGQFTLYFKCLPTGVPSTSTASLFQGYLRTVARTDGRSEVEFFMHHGDPDQAVAQDDYAMRERVHVIADKAAGTGRAYAERRRVEDHGGTPYTEAGEYQLQYDASYVARREVSNGNALEVLDRNDFTACVFRYGIYDATTEARVEQLSGFPIETENGANGWAGFHGIWFPDSVTPTDGQTVYRRSFADNSRTPYTLVVAPGKLVRRERAAVTLGDLADEDLDYFSPSAGGEQRVRFTGSDFVRTAVRVNGEWQVVDPPVSIANTFTTGQWLVFWSQARGSVEFGWPATLTGSVPAYVWSQTTVTADSAELQSGDLTLHGYFRQLRANITSDQANYQNSETPYLPDATTASNGNQTYVFDRDTLLLTLAGNPVTLADGIVIEQGPGLSGLTCGPLFATPLAQLDDMQAQSVSYEWSIGSNPWNQLRTLRDGNGAFVAFDPPLRFTYVHDEDGSPFDGRTFFLEWDGTNLGGIPFDQGDDGRWYPMFNVPSGTTLSADGRTFVVKQLEGEQLMVPVGSPNVVYAAQGFDLDGQSITAPTADPYRDPETGDKPTIAAAPRYVGGVAQQ
ncbi:MAG: hypothetical protein JNL08_20820 [Planctomycetes bacterium]|nr:hypothetical protein [Planctomycetota bacterium]